MTWLKAAGAAILKAVEEGASIVSGSGPLISLFSKFLPAPAQVIVGDFQSLSTVILQTEVIGQAANLTGDQKRVAAAPQVAQIVLQALHDSGAQVADQTAFATAIDHLTGAVADIWNAVDAGSIKTTSVKK